MHDLFTGSVLCFVMFSLIESYFNILCVFVCNLKYIFLRFRYSVLMLMLNANAQ